jgi:hypothetical protein
VSFVLEVGSVTEVVRVESRLSSVRTETATVGKLIDRQQIESSQLNGRNPLFLALFTPGIVTQNPFGSSQSFGLSGGPFYIEGSRIEENLFTFDGAVGVRTRSNGTSITTANLDTIQEIQVLAANYNAEYGRSSGGQIQLVTQRNARLYTAAHSVRNSARCKRLRAQLNPPAIVRATCPPDPGASPNRFATTNSATR